MAYNEITYLIDYSLLRIFIAGTRKGEEKGEGSFRSNPPSNVLQNREENEGQPTSVRTDTEIPFYSRQDFGFGISKRRKNYVFADKDGNFLCYTLVKSILTNEIQQQKILMLRDVKKLRIL